MFLKRPGLASLIVGLAVGVTGCTGGYGYSGVNLGYASGYGAGDGYYDGGYGTGYYGSGYYGAGYGGYGTGAFGWYGDYYYPGAGIYVYDRYRRPYRWNDGQRRYWEQRRGSYRGDRNWNGFDRDRGRPDGDAYRGTWHGGDRNGYPNRGDRDGYYRGRGGVAPGATPGAATRSLTPNVAGRTAAPRSETRTYAPRAPRSDGQSSGWRGRSRGDRR